jgi:hypothetical protein
MADESQLSLFWARLISLLYAKNNPKEGLETKPLQFFLQLKYDGGWPHSLLTVINQP